jgi:hypothetical protein
VTVADTKSDLNNITSDVTSSPEYMLTTVDNPYDPFTEWDQWYVWDRNAGYHTPGFLARIARLGDDLSDGDQHQAIQSAIDEIVRENVLGVFRKVKEGDVKAFSK